MQPFSRDFFEVFMNLGLTLVLSVVVSYLYRFTHAGYAYSRSFNVSLIGTSMIVCMTMMVIANRVALSLGLVGAISVIRFRTAVKDPRDLSFIFLSVTVGLACSTADYILATAGTLSICAVLLVLHYVQFGGMITTDYTLTFCLNSPDRVAQLQDVAKPMFSQMVLRSSAQIDDQTFEYVYMVYPRKIRPDQVVGELRAKVEGISRISLIRPESFIEI